jgi:hypothetical protein
VGPATVRTRIIGLAPSVALGVGLLLWTALFVRLARRLWFTGDDFNFLLHRSISLGGDHGLLVPHNEHWSTIPIVAFRLNYAIFGMHHYLPYAILPIGCHILISLLLFTLLRLSGVTPWSAVLAALVAVFTIGAAGAENTLWDFQVGFLGSCVFGLLALTLFVSGRWGAIGAALGVVALVLSLMSSGMGLVMVLWCGVFRFMRHGLKVAVATVALPALVYVAWYVAYGRGNIGAQPVKLSVAPIAAMHGLGFIWSSATSIPNSGPVVLLGLVAVVALPRLGEPLFTLAASGMVTVVGAYLLLGYSRSAFGVDATLRSRYAYFGLVLTLPALGAGVDLLARRLRSRPPRVGAIAWVTAATVVLAVGSAQATRAARAERVVVAENRARIVAAAQLVESGSPVLRSMPMPAMNPDIDVASLKKSSVRAALPDVEPGPLARLYVAANLQVDVRASTFGFPPAPRTTWSPPVVGRSGRSRESPGCVGYDLAGETSLELPLDGQPVQVRVATSGSGFTTLLSAGSLQSQPTQWSARPGVAVYVASTARDATLKIVLPAGRATLCAD